MILTVVFKTIAHNKFDAALEAKNISYIEMDTKPTPLNSILWNGQVETETGYLSGYYSLFDSKEITFLREIPKNHHLLDPYREQKVVKQLMSISVGWYYLEKIEDGLLFTDIRFGQIGFDDNAPYMWKYKLTETKGILQAEKIDFKPKGAMMSKALGELFERLKGN
jgi:inner membrane protein